MFAVKTVDLCKTYMMPARRGQKVAVSSLNIAVQSGEIYGFLGPNGAGKTTTIKILLDFIRPSSGSALLFGIPVNNPEARRTIGYLPEQPYYHKFLTPFEILRAQATLADVPRKERKSAISDALTMVGLEEYSRLPVSKLSKGLAQRVGIAQALVHKPKLLIMDEPTSGLDPIGRRHIRDLLSTLKNSGTTIFLSSHVLSEIEYLCDRVGILSQGKLVAEGSPSDIKSSDPIMRLSTTIIQPQMQEIFSSLGAEFENREGETNIIIPVENAYKAIRLLEQHNLPLISAVSDRETLEDAFMRLAA